MAGVRRPDTPQRSRGPRGTPGVPSVRARDRGPRPGGPPLAAPDLDQWVESGSRSGPVRGSRSGSRDGQLSSLVGPLDLHRVSALVRAHAEEAVSRAAPPMTSPVRAPARSVSCPGAPRIPTDRAAGPDLPPEPAPQRAQLEPVRRTLPPLSTAAPRPPRAAPHSTIARQSARHRPPCVGDAGWCVGDVRSTGGEPKSRGRDWYRFRAVKKKHAYIFRAAGPGRP